MASDTGPRVPLDWSRVAALDSQQVLPLAPEFSDWEFEPPKINESSPKITGHLPSQCSLRNVLNGEGLRKSVREENGKFVQREAQRASTSFPNPLCSARVFVRSTEPSLRGASKYIMAIRALLSEFRPRPRFRIFGARRSSNSCVPNIWEDIARYLRRIVVFLFTKKSTSQCPWSRKLHTGS
jgi:hypothetical protein